MDAPNDPAVRTIQRIAEMLKTTVEEHEGNDDVAFDLTVGLIEVGILFGRSVGFDVMSLVMMFTEAMNHTEDVRHRRLASSDSTTPPSAPDPTPLPKVDRTLTEAQLREVAIRLKEGGHVH